MLITSGRSSLLTLTGTMMRPTQCDRCDAFSHGRVDLSIGAVALDRQAEEGLLLILGSLRSFGIRSSTVLAVPNVGYDNR
jgi:hypothetical protein